MAVLMALILIGTPAMAEERTPSSCSIESIRDALIGRWFWLTSNGAWVVLTIEELELVSPCTKQSSSPMFAIHGTYTYNGERYPWETAVGKYNQEGDPTFILVWKQGGRFVLTLKGKKLIGKFNRTPAEFFLKTKS
jgi:hypothetical protein